MRKGDMMIIPSVRDISFSRDVTMLTGLAEQPEGGSVGREPAGA
jgi:hypothetical protein